jgi:mono/diheme cytochrome c family protein
MTRAMLRTWMMAGLPLVAALSAAPAQSAERTEQALHGQQVYNHWCLPCHGREPGRYALGQTGTLALQVKYEGKLPAVLEDRTDLTPPVVAVFVRKGINTMPFFRRTEISDADLAAIGAYLSRKLPDANPPARAK